MKQYTESEFAAFCDGVSRSAALLDKLAETLNGEITKLANECAEIGRGGNGYNNTKTKMRAFESHYQLLQKTASEVRKLRDPVTVIVPTTELVDSVIDFAVATSAAGQSIQPAHRPSITLRPMSLTGLRPATPTGFPAPVQPTVLKPNSTVPSQQSRQAPRISIKLPPR